MSKPLQPVVIQDLVRRLLLTWPLRQLREDIGLPANPPATEDWWWTYELTYGFDRQNYGRLEERQELLVSTLRVIADQGRDVQAISAALGRIKQDILQDALEGLRIDTTRILTQEAVQVRKQLTEGLTRVLDLYRRLSPETAAEKRLRRRDARTSLRVSPTRRRMAVYAKVLHYVQQDPMLRLYAITTSTHPQRRGHAGNPHNRWIKEAKVVLQHAGVPQVLRTDLLRSIGLLPSRSEGQ